MDEMVIITMERFEKMKFEKEGNEAAINSYRLTNSRLAEELSKEHSALLDLTEETRRLRWFKTRILLERDQRTDCFTLGQAVNKICEECEEGDEK